MSVEYRKYELSKKEIMRWCYVSIPALSALGYLFYHSLIVGALFCFLSIPLKKFYAEYLGAKRRDVLAAQFKDLLVSLSSSFATGRQMTEALAEAEENLGLIYEESTPIMAELREMNMRLGEGRESESDVLFDFADRSANDEIVGFTDVYFTCITTGADQVKAVARASELIMDKIEIKSELRMLTAQKKLEAKILAALPPIILAFLSAASPDYISPLYGTPGGLLVMTSSLLAMGMAFRWSMKITDIKL